MQATPAARQEAASKPPHLQQRKALGSATAQGEAAAPDVTCSVRMQNSHPEEEALPGELCHTTISPGTWTDGPIRPVDTLHSWPNYYRRIEAFFCLQMLKM